MVKRIRAAIMIGCALAACLGLGALMTPIHAQEPAQRSPSEGIKVHGDWVVEVHEPDGTLVSRQAFRNALEVGDKGDYALALALARRLTLVGWFVQLASGAHALQGPCSSGTRCHLVEGTDFSVSVLKASLRNGSRKIQQPPSSRTCPKCSRSSATRRSSLSESPRFRFSVFGVSCIANKATGPTRATPHRSSRILVSA